jgi:hypothetical protein
VTGSAVNAAPALAQTQRGSGVGAVPAASAPVTRPAQDYSSQRRTRTTTPRTYNPRYTPPRSNTAPRYIYPGSRNALDTCAFC